MTNATTTPIITTPAPVAAPITAAVILSLLLVVLVPSEGISMTGCVVIGAAAGERVGLDVGLAEGLYNVVGAGVGATVLLFLHNRQSN